MLGEVSKTQGGESSGVIY